MEKAGSDWSMVSLRKLHVSKWVREDPKSKEFVYAGTEKRGLYVSFQWRSVLEKFPAEICRSTITESDDGNMNDRGNSKVGAFLGD